jgi:hypothetical protein
MSVLTRIAAFLNLWNVEPAAKPGKLKPEGFEASMYRQLVGEAEIGISLGRLSSVAISEGILALRNQATFILPQVAALPDCPCPVMVDAHQLLIVRNILFRGAAVMEDLLRLLEEEGLVE